MPSMKKLRAARAHSEWRGYRPARLGAGGGGGRTAGGGAPGVRGSPAGWVDGGGAVEGEDGRRLDFFETVVCCLKQCCGAVV